MDRSFGTKSSAKRKMQRPLAFHSEARKAVQRVEKHARGPVKFGGLRQVNVVAHVATRAGRPTRWSGFAPRKALSSRNGRVHVPMQSRCAVAVEGEKTSTMLVFNEANPGSERLEPASTIVAGASAVPSAIETVLQQRSRFPNEVVAVFNTVVTGKIYAPGMTLERLRAHPQSIVTPKFPGRYAHARRKS